jgi:hypothetical protein
VSALAHDREEHMEKSEKLDCSAMEKMDHSKMDMNDPVMQAMMKKCMNQMNHEKDDSVKGQDETGEGEDHDHEHNDMQSEKSVESTTHDHGAH